MKSFISSIKAEILAVKITRSSDSSQSLPTRILESGWPKFLFYFLNLLRQGEKHAKFFVNPCGSCQSCWLNWHGIALSVDIQLHICIPTSLTAEWSTVPSIQTLSCSWYRSLTSSTTSLFGPSPPTTYRILTV